MAIEKIFVDIDGQTKQNKFCAVLLDNQFSMSLFDGTFLKREQRGFLTGGHVSVLAVNTTRGTQNARPFRREHLLYLSGMLLSPHFPPYPLLYPRKSTDYIHLYKRIQYSLQAYINN
jgi:hypothetical protein